MRTLIKTLIFLGLLVGLGFAIYYPTAEYLRKRNQPIYRFVEVERGTILRNVNATGTVEPTRRVSVGAFVSGPIEELCVDFNDRVKKGELMARIDPRLFKSNVLRDQALLKTRQAEVKRAEARLQQAINQEDRAIALSQKGANYISQDEIEELRFNRMAAEADLSVAKTAVEQANANLENSQANLEYTEVRSPTDGIVIDRKVDEGQTLAAQFQTPEMFVVAPQMHEKMHIYASVDEADIGLIQRAQREKQPVSFTVDAYPDQVFSDGYILEVRLSSLEEQNVVTYPVVVETPNPDMQLLPGMTANLSFQIEQRPEAIRIPNSALRFYPPDRNRVHPEDRPILDGVELAKSESASQNQSLQSAEQRAKLRRSHSIRHVWYVDGDFLRAKEVEVGISDSRFTELISGDIDPGLQLVAGEKPKT